MRELLEKKCKPCEGGTSPLNEKQIKEYLKSLPGWECQEGYLTRIFSFKNYYETSAFVNAVVWIAHREDHHPDIAFGYKSCTVRYVTHAIQGLSENDFICAAKISQLLSQGIN